MHSRSCLKIIEIHWVDARRGGQSAYHFQPTMGNWMGGQTAYHFQPTILKSQPTISKPSLPFEIPAYHSRISPDTSSKTSPTCYNAYSSLNDAR